MFFEAIDYCLSDLAFLGPGSGGAHSLHVWLKVNDLFGRSFQDLNQKRFSTVYLLFPLGKDLFTWCAGERSRGKVYPSVRSWNVCGVNPPCRLNIFAPKSASQDMLWHQTTSQDNRVSLRFGRGAAGYCYNQFEA